MTEPNVARLTITSCMLHNIVGHYIILRGGPRDEVSYMEAFVINSIITGRRLCHAPTPTWVKTGAWHGTGTPEPAFRTLVGLFHIYNFIMK